MHGLGVLKDDLAPLSGDHNCLRFSALPVGSRRAAPDHTYNVRKNCFQQYYNYLAPGIIDVCIRPS